MENKSILPSYYKGKIKGIKAHEVIADYDLTYNIGTAVTYLLRAGKKPNNPIVQDIKKAINHLQFELKKIKEQEQAELDVTNEKLFRNANYTY